MANINSSYQEVRIPFAKMTFTPDVPSTALAPNEYNDGVNVETDVRGIRSMAGDQTILDALPAGYGPPTFVTGGFRQNGQFWFVVALTGEGAQPGSFWASDGDTTWYNITPTDSGFDSSGYGQATNITEAWNGTVLFLNDEANPPFFWPDQPNAVMVSYSNQVPLDIYDIQPASSTTRTVILDDYNEMLTASITGTTLTVGTLSSGSPAIAVGQYLTGTGVAPGTRITANISGSGPGSTWTVNISQTTGALTNVFLTTWQFPPFAVGSYVSLTEVEPRYYNGTWLVTASTVHDVTILCNISDAYSTGGLVAPAYSWNYNADWSNVFAKFMRLYNTPNVGSILVAGNLTATNAVTAATELYPVTVQWSQAFGLNQAPTTWTPTVTNIANSLEVPLRGPALDAFPSNGQFFLCSYWDTVVFSPINYSTTSAPILGVRQYNQGRGLLSSNCWANTDKLVYGVDARDIWVFDGQDFQGLGTQRVKNWFYDQLDPEYYDRVYMEVNSQRSQVEIYYYTTDASRPELPVGVPNKMLSYRYDLDCWNAPRDVNSATFACEAPIYDNATDSSLPEWQPLLASRTVVYAQGLAESRLVQKDQGFAFLPTALNPTGAITSAFRRDNIKLLKDYSGRLMVHRILPEVVNLGAVPNQYNNIPLYPATGNITVTIEGANSVGSEPTAKTPVEMAVDADGNAGANPWAQINQNAFRVNTIELGDSSDNAVWMCSATTWQITQVEDDR